MNGESKAASREARRKLRGAVEGLLSLVHDEPAGAARWTIMNAAVQLAASERGLKLRLSRGRPRRSLLAAIGPALGVAASAAPGSDGAALGAIYETLLARSPVDGGGSSARKRAGAYFTPSQVVERLLDGVIAARSMPVAVCDPACGCGNFLIAAARRLGGIASAAGRIYGIDLDPLAVEVCRAAIRLEAGDPDLDLERQIVAADALLTPWKDLFPQVFRRGGFDVIVGNPPYLNQLSRQTAATRSYAAALRERFGDALGAYTDPAALFLLAAVEQTRRGGRITLVLPQSFLGTRDAAGVRKRVLDRGSLRSLWIAREPVFDAGVMVCAPTVRIGATPQSLVSRCTGLRFSPAPSAPICGKSWSSLAAVDVPIVPFAPGGRLSDIARATADFRDQYYGLRGCIAESRRGAVPPGHAPLITTGLIDVGRSMWSRRPTRFDKRPWTAPMVRLARLPAGLQPWAKARLVPKVLLATQTRVLEAVVDEPGAWLPAVPVITIVPRRKSDLWRLGAALLSPAASMWAAMHHGSAGLSTGSIKLSAKETMQIPLPRVGTAWKRATDLLRRQASAPQPGNWARFGLLMNAAYGLEEGSDEVLEWWLARIEGPTERKLSQSRGSRGRLALSRSDA